MLRYLLVTLGLCLQIVLCAQTPSFKRPNIVYIYADDLGYGEIGAYGQTKIKTPHLDRMASEGMKFTRHYASAPVCAPSRCALLTGKHTGQTYIRGNYELGGFADSLEGGQMPLPEGMVTLPSLLQKAGYRTGLFGKWGLGMPHNGGSPLQHGFDVYYGYLDQKQAHNYYPTHLWRNDQLVKLNNSPIQVHSKLEPTKVTPEEFEKFIGTDFAPDKIMQEALTFIEQEKKGPFFLYLPLTLPHVSLQLPKKYMDPYKGLFPEEPYLGQRGYAPQQFPLSAYAGMISYLDEQVGRVLQQLKQLGLDSTTIVLFSSDNGPSNAGGADLKYFNSKGSLRGQKMELYEGGIRVPLLARWPGMIKAGSVSGHVSAQYDVFATILELKRSAEHSSNGISFWSTIGGNSARQKHHDYLYFEYPENGGQVAILQGKWKAIKRGLQKNPAAQWQLFDLENDPGEQDDLAGQHLEKLKQFDTILQKEHRCAQITDWEFIHPRHLNQLP